MRTSLIETAEADQLILGTADPAERLLLLARAQLSPDFADKIAWQRQVHDLARLHGREQLVRDIRKVDAALFEAPQHRRFRKLIFSIFKR